MGWNAQGDLGGLTFYTSARKRLVFFPKSPPLSPPSTLQLMQRDKFRLVATLWRKLAPGQRAAWNAAQHAAHLGVTGYDLFVHYILRSDEALIRTIEQQTGLTLIPAPPPP